MRMSCKLLTPTRVLERRQNRTAEPSDVNLHKFSLHQLSWGQLVF